MEKQVTIGIIIKGFAVVKHSAGVGYVVRTAYRNPHIEGWWIPSPYSKSTPVRVYFRESAAKKLADKLNSEASNA
jgi:hypothetical protein